MSDRVLTRFAVHSETILRESKIDRKLVSFILLLFLASTLTVAFTATTVSAENQGVVTARLERHHVYEASVFEDSVSNVFLNGFSWRSYYIRPRGVDVADAKIETVTPYPDTPENFPSIDWDPTTANFTVEPLDGHFRYEWSFPGWIPDTKQAAVWIQTNFSVEFEPKFACQRIWNSKITSRSVTQKLTVIFEPSIAGGVHIQVRTVSTPEASATIIRDSASSSPPLRDHWLDEENGKAVGANWGGDCEAGTYVLSIDITVVNEIFPETVLYKPSVGIGLGYGPPEPPLVTSDSVMVEDDIDGDGADESSITYSGAVDYDWRVIVRDEFSIELPSYVAQTSEVVPPVREPPPPQSVVASMALGGGVSIGFTALMSISGLAQSVNSAVSRLPVPDWLKDFLTFYAEETFEPLTKEEIRARKRRLMTRIELASLVFAAIVLLAVFTYVEVNGLPSFTDVRILLATMPSVLFSVVMVFVVSQLLETITARTLDVWGEFKVWVYGLVALITTGILLSVPFASPGKVEYQGDVDERKAGLMATMKILSFLTLGLPFSLFYSFGLATIADAGLMMSMMTACYSAFPFKPLEGEAVFHYKRSLWLLTFLSSFTLFLCVTLNVLPHTGYLLVGIIATVLFTVLLHSGKSARMKESL